MAQRVNICAHPSQLELGKVDSQILLELFPFALILDREMRVRSAGEKIVETWILHNPSKRPQSFYGSHISDIFKLRRPKGVSFEWQTVLQLNLVIFELELIRSDTDLKANKSDETKPKAGSSTPFDRFDSNSFAADCDQDDLLYAVEHVQNGESKNDIFFSVICFRTQRLPTH